MSVDSRYQKTRRAFEPQERGLSSYGVMTAVKKWMYKAEKGDNLKLEDEGNGKFALYMWSRKNER